MTKLIVNSVDSRSTSTEFKDIVTANHEKQWLDSYGVIKAFKNSIDENLNYRHFMNITKISRPIKGKEPKLKEFFKNYLES